MDTARDSDRNVIETLCRTCGFHHEPGTCQRWPDNEAVERMYRTHLDWTTQGDDTE